MNVTEWLDVCPLSVYSVQSDILHEARRRENTHLNTHRYLLLQGGTMRFQSADSSFTLHPGDMLFTPSGYHCGISLHPNYINRLIRRATGMSLHQYIIKTRMQKAKELLAFSTLSIAEIAQSLCFYDSSHFSATFQKHTGVTPSFFRSSF